MDKTRTAIAALALSATGLVYIAQREGYSEQAYPDPVHGAAVPTVGFGTTHGVKARLRPPLRSGRRPNQSSHRLALCWT